MTQARRPSPTKLFGEDDTIGEVLLRWAGQDSIWSANELNDNYSPLRDILHACRSLDWDRVEFAPGRPGAAGYCYEISIPDERATRAEVAMLVHELVGNR